MTSSPFKEGSQPKVNKKTIFLLPGPYRQICRDCCRKENLLIFSADPGGFKANSIKQ